MASRDAPGVPRMLRTRVSPSQLQNDFGFNWLSRSPSGADGPQDPQFGLDSEVLLDEGARLELEHVGFSARQPHVQSQLITGLDRSPESRSIDAAKIVH